MLVLYETPAGYALFKCDESKMTDVDDIAEIFADQDKAAKQ